ncbi:retrovirus-related pol polyprotein from transposon TNT 1-94 [Tanacetum coccineum]|uniref:Retrovirus-related pol polyprotein from transposon TNT 1-94 n=1 Tax=Tanacetum coccineum TaxID=301880 RepID=A0ABQ5DE42_9ASTR
MLYSAAYRSLGVLHNALDFACKHAKRCEELLVYVRDTCPNAYKPGEKLIVVTPMNKVKKVRFSKPVTSSSNIQQVVQIILWYLDLWMFKPYDRDSSQLMNFVVILAPLFLWAEAINTACYTQNCSLIRLRYNKTPYELMHEKKPDLSFLHVFGSLCYPTNDSKDLGKLNAKADIGIFVGYAPAKKAFRIYNRRTQKIMETIHVTFNELTAMASEQFGSGPRLQLMTPPTSSSGLVPHTIP